MTAHRQRQLEQHQLCGRSTVPAQVRQSLLNELILDRRERPGLGQGDAVPKDFLGGAHAHGRQDAGRHFASGDADIHGATMRHGLPRQNENIPGGLLHDREI